MELLNEINGIVERNQWFCFLKLSVLLAETVGFTTKKRGYALFGAYPRFCLSEGIA